MRYSAYKLNEQGDNIQPWTYSFPSLEPVCCSMSSFNWCFLTCIKIFFSRHMSGGLVFPSLEEFSTVCCDPHSQRRYSNQWSRSRYSSGILLLFLWYNRFGNLISGFSAFSKSSLNSWKFSGHILLKPRLENFEHYFASIWATREAQWGYQSIIVSMNSNGIPIKLTWCTL